MNYQKAYKEALARAKEQLEGAKVFDYKEEQIAHDIRTTTYAIFPELAESKDEKVRKEIINYFAKGKEYLSLCSVGKDNILAWLEKQGEKKPQRMISAETKESLLHDKYEGLTDFERTLANICIGWIGEELGWKQYIKDNADVLLKIAVEKFNSVQDVPFEQKPADKVKPKFKNGQWIVWKDKCYKVNYNGCGYELVDQNGLSTSLEYGTIDENAHIWDIIKDAKAGDVLVDVCDSLDNPLIFIFKDCKHIKHELATLSDYHSFCYLKASKKQEFGIDGWHNEHNLMPATKEQRDLLFAKMKEAGYEWDSEKKELKKIEQKPTWSEEDEEMCQETIDWFEKKCFPYALESENPARESINWLKSIKQKIKGE